jgi:hypothetical protein
MPPVDGQRTRQSRTFFIRGIIAIVHRAGSNSWRFEHDNLEMLHQALLVRDAAMLQVPGSADVPPPLIGEVPTGSAVMSEPDRAVAAGQWLQWWRKMLEQAVQEVRIRKAEDPGQDTLTRLKARVSGRQDICDPPEFCSLAAVPELKSAVVATRGAYRAWSADAARQAAPREQLFKWELVRDAAHHAAASLGVSVGEMDAVAHVIAVQGHWSCIAGAGCGVCSVAVAVDPDAASDLLHKLFVSGSHAGS